MTLHILRHASPKSRDLLQPELSLHKEPSMLSALLVVEKPVFNLPGALILSPSPAIHGPLSPFCNLDPSSPLDSPAGPSWAHSREHTPRARPWEGRVSRTVGEEWRPLSLLQGTRESTQSPTRGPVLAMLPGPLAPQECDSQGNGGH